MSGKQPRPDGLDALKWESFWDISNPLRAATILFEIYGAEATHAASICADQARADERDDDVRFWDAVTSKLLEHLPE